MKSYRLIIISLLTFFCISLNAQFFIGGNVGFSSSGNKTDDGSTALSKSSGYTVDFSPKLGMFLSEDLAFGLALNLSLSGSTSGITDELKNTSYGIGVSPFVRYYALRFNKFSIFGQGNIGVNFSGSSSELNGTQTDGPNVTRLSIGAYPGLSYDISDKFSLETSINVLNFGFNYTITKDGTQVSKGSNFNLGGGLNSIVSIGSITIGAIYKF